MLGIGAVTDFQDSPVLVRDIPAEKRVIQISAGLNHTAAVCDDGQVRPSRGCRPAVLHPDGAPHNNYGRVALPRCSFGASPKKVVLASAT